MCVVVWFNFFVYYVEVRFCVYKMSIEYRYKYYWKMYCLINGTSKEGAQYGL